MTQIVPFKGPAPRTKTVPRVLYIGPVADELCNLLVNHVGRVEIAYEHEVQAAFAQMRRRQFDIVIVDQRDENLATRLILPVLQSLGYPVKPVVISSLSDVGHYLAIPGVARVLSAPIKEAQLLRILGLERRTRDSVETPLKAPEPKQLNQTQTKSSSRILSDGFMNIVSTLYKRSAFVLLSCLFVAFAFYGVLIAFFLLSPGWGAPMTLTRGHAMVNKVERDITETKVSLNLTEQRLSDDALVRVTAEKDLAEAEALVKYSAGTVKKEMQSRHRQSKVLTQSIKRLKKVRGQLEKQVNGKGPSADLERLYQKRLIDRSSYSAGTLNLIEAGQRLAAIEIEIDQAEGQITEFEMSQEMLASLEVALQEGKGLSGITATASDLLLLTKQASDALASRDLAKSKLISVGESRATLLKSQKVLTSQLAELEGSALARALIKRVDVVFVPYGNEAQFAEGGPLYSCSFTILWCSKAGVVGQSLPGEISSVHPFFGKPIRGSFVEVKLDTPDAAMREIIHGNRKPLFL
jgi:hypothetical protein